MNKVQRSLLDILCLTQDEINLELSASEWQAIYQLAKGQHIAPFLYSRLKSGSYQVPDKALAALKTSFLQNTGRNLGMMMAFQQLSERVEMQKIPMIPLKGIFLANAVYQNVGERVIGDLDLLVPKTQIVQAFEVAEQIGYEATRQPVVEEWLASKHQLCPQVHHQNGVTLEWHWHVFPPSQNHRLSIHELWERAESIVVSNQPVLALSPEDTVLHLTNHISYHHHFLFGLRNLIDLMLFCQKFEAALDWDCIGSRAKRWQIDKGGFVALRIAKRFFEAPIPEAFFAKFEPEGFDNIHVERGIEQLFVLPAHARAIPMTLQKVQSETGPINQGRELYRALFPTPTWMAARYGIEPDSMPRWQMFLHRWRSLARQALMKMSEGREGKTAVSTILARRKKLKQWLQG
ncbi:MAG: nucleotidyltransferase family protein [Chloroflexota bacterium]